MITEEEIKQNDHISIETIQKDIQDTQEEIDRYEEELDALRSNPRDNRLDIFFREGRILKRKTFIRKLEQILEYREENGYDKFT